MTSRGRTTVIAFCLAFVASSILLFLHAWVFGGSSVESDLMIREPPRDSFLVRVTLSRLDLPNRRADVGVRLYASDEMLLRLHRIDGAPIFERVPGIDAIRVRERHEGDSLRVRVTDHLVDTTDALLDASIPFSGLHGRRVAVATAHSELRLTGDATRYPRDRYIINVGTKVSLPWEQADGTGDDLPVTVWTDFSEPASGWRDSPYEPGSGLTFVSRSMRVQLFVLIVAAAPLLLVAPAVATWRRSQSRGLPVEVAAALIALLPLRTILVPDDISGLTVVDHLLGAEVVVFIALAVLTNVPASGTRD